MNWKTCIAVAALGASGLAGPVRAQTAVPEVVKPPTETPAPSRPGEGGVIAPPVPSAGSTPIIRPPVAGTMPVIPPPGSPGGDRTVVPK